MEKQQQEFFAVVRVSLKNSLATEIRVGRFRAPHAGPVFRAVCCWRKTIRKNDRLVRDCQIESIKPERPSNIEESAIEDIGEIIGPLRMSQIIAFFENLPRRRQLQGKAASAAL
jgi:hypothetical protein